MDDPCVFQSLRTGNKSSALLTKNSTFVADLFLFLLKAINSQVFIEYFVLDIMAYYVFDLSDLFILDFQKAQAVPRHSARILTDIASSLRIQDFNLLYVKYH